MSKHTYNEILSKAKTCKDSVEKEYNIGISSKWSYYIAKAILHPKQDISKITFDTAPKPIGTHISRQISKAEYLQLANDLITFVEKHKRLPNYLTYKNHKIRTRLYTYVFSKILVYYNKHGVLPGDNNVNFKVFYKPEETKDKVYGYYCKKTKTKPKTMDEILAFILKYFSYQHYFDDHKSNFEVIDTRSGNCTDLLQMLVNLLLKLGYEVEILHVKCRKSGEGHVRLKARHKKYTEDTWVYRDVACVADGGGIKCNWCMDGTLLAVNPSWFMENLNR